LVVPIRALVISITGVVIAYLWFSRSYVALATLVATGTGLGWVCAILGDYLLPSKPVLALELLELSIFAPATVAAAGAAAVTVVGVELTGTGTPESKALAAVLATGITTFISVVIMSWAGDKEDSSLSNFIRDRFRAHFKRTAAGVSDTARVKYFDAESDGELWVQSHDFKGVSGWHRGARRRRARGVAAELSKDQNYR